MKVFRFLLSSAGLVAATAVNLRKDSTANAATAATAPEDYSNSKDGNKDYRKPYVPPEKRDGWDKPHFPPKSKDGNEDYGKPYVPPGKPYVPPEKREYKPIFPPKPKAITFGEEKGVRCHGGMKGKDGKLMCEAGMRKNFTLYFVQIAHDVAATLHEQMLEVLPTEDFFVLDDTVMSSLTVLDQQPLEKGIAVDTIEFEKLDGVEECDKDGCSCGSFGGTANVEFGCKIFRHKAPLGKKGGNFLKTVACGMKMEANATKKGGGSDDDNTTALMLDTEEDGIDEWTYVLPHIFGDNDNKEDFPKPDAVCFGQEKGMRCQGGMKDGLGKMECEAGMRQNVTAKFPMAAEEVATTMQAQLHQVLPKKEFFLPPNYIMFNEYGVNNEECDDVEGCHCGSFGGKATMNFGCKWSFQFDKKNGTAHKSVACGIKSVIVGAMKGEVEEYDEEDNWIDEEYNDIEEEEFEYEEDNEHHEEE